MKISLVTTYPKAEEVARIKEESLLAGHEFNLIDFNSFKFNVVHGKINMQDFSDLEADVIIIRGIFVAIHALTPLIDFLHNRKIKVFDNKLSTHKYAINKIADFMKLSVAKVAIPDTYYSRSFDDYSQFADKLGYPVVVKSTRMGKGASVVKIDSKSELDKFISEYMVREDKDNSKDLIMQKFIDYKYDLRVFVMGEHMFCMRRIPSGDDFRANFSLGGSVEPFNLNESLVRLSKRAIEAVNLDVAGVDILLDKDNNPYILEVNHTPGMVGIERATGENISKMYLEYAIKHAK